MYLGEFENTPGVMDDIAWPDEPVFTDGGWTISSPGMPSAAGGEWGNLITQGITAYTTVKSAEANRDAQIALASRGIVPQGYASQLPSYIRYPLATAQGSAAFSPFSAVNGAGNLAPVLILGAALLAAYFIVKD